MTCERCWRDAFVRAQTLGGTQADHYRALLDERYGNPREMAKCRGEDPE